MERHVTSSRFGLALALVAAAACGAGAAWSGAGLSTGVWRAIVAFLSVWTFQQGLAAAWEITGVVPAPVSEDTQLR